MSFVHQDPDFDKLLGIAAREMAFEKLNVMACRHARDPVDADSFVRHYEDAAQIVRAIDQLPPIETTVSELARDMVAQKDVRALPSPNEPALRLDGPAKRQAAERAYARIAPMFWGPRIPLKEACGEIREWLRHLEMIRQGPGGISNSRILDARLADVAQPRETQETAGRGRYSPCCGLKSEGNIEAH